jgi:hypothetical protein
VDGLNHSHSDSALLLLEVLFPELHLRNPISHELVQHSNGQHHRSGSFTFRTDRRWFVFVTDSKIGLLKLQQQKPWLVFRVLHGLSLLQKQQLF